jgi:hypothetical protein
MRDLGLTVDLVSGRGQRAGPCGRCCGRRRGRLERRRGLLLEEDTINNPAWPWEGRVPGHTPPVRPVGLAAHTDAPPPTPAPMRPIHGLCLWLVPFGAACKLRIGTVTAFGAWERSHTHGAWAAEPEMVCHKPKLKESQCPHIPSLDLLLHHQVYSSKQQANQDSYHILLSPSSS